MKWIKASEQLPPSLDMHEVFYKVDGKRRDGILIQAQDGGIFFEYKEAAMFNPVDDLSRVEWLDETPSRQGEEADKKINDAAAWYDAEMDKIKTENEDLRIANKVLSEGISEIIRTKSFEQYSKWKDEYCKRHNLCPICVMGGYECDSDHKYWPKYTNNI